MPSVTAYAPEVLEREIAPYVRWANQKQNRFWGDATVHPDAPSRHTASAGHCGLSAVFLLPLLQEGWRDGDFEIACGDVLAVRQGLPKAPIQGHAFIISTHRERHRDIDIIDGAADQAEGVELPPCVVASAGLIKATYGVRYSVQDTYSTVEEYLDGPDGADGSLNLGGRLSFVLEELRITDGTLDLSVAAFQAGQRGA